MRLWKLSLKECRLKKLLDENVFYSVSLLRGAWCGKNICFNLELQLCGASVVARFFRCRF